MAAATDGRRRARRRLRVSPRFLLLGLFLLLLLLVLNASVFLLYRQVRGTIEQELGERLLSIAAATAAGISPATVRALADTTAPEVERLQGRLARVRFDTGVGDLYLCGPQQRHLVGAEESFPRGYAHPALELHYAAATAALAGVPATSELYRVGDVYLETAFAPVFDETGEVLGVLGAEGGASFYEGLWQLRRQVLVIGAAGMLLVIALALLFSRLLRDQARAEQTLRETSTLAAAGELAAILAHEIRNPLAVIASRAERVRAKVEQGRPPEEVLSWFEAIPAEVDRLDRILAQYLAYARPADLGEESAEVASTLEAVLGLLTNDLARRGIRLEQTRDGGGVLRVRMAPVALHQVLLNLLLNARDAMPAGGCLTLRTRRVGESVEVRVGDTGCGMTAGEQRHAFDTFYTTKPHGSGLGLAVVRAMLDLYGGRVEVASRPGEGSTFTLQLPGLPAPGGTPSPAH